jgi:hypothetical protein
MNTREESEFDPHEWAAQERGLRAASEGRETVQAPAERRYRRIASAVRSAPLGAPPADFAATVVAAVMQRQRRRERLWVDLFLGFCALVLLWAVCSYGPRSWRVLNESLGGDWAWLLVGLICLGASWLLRQWREWQAQVPDVRALH